MVALNPLKRVHDNCRFGEDKVKAICQALYPNKQETHLVFTE